MKTLEQQQRLKALGFDPGLIDGIPGGNTRRAIKAFQASRGLTVDGIVGPQTRAALQAANAGGVVIQMPASVEPLALPWFEEAKRLLGLKEGPGAKDNPTILGWAKRLALAYAHDSTAWCGLFVAQCMSAVPDEPLPANPLGARNWLKMGISCEPQLGAVLVFWRGSKSGWQGHVGFYAGERADAYKVLGGNQSDSVSYAWIAKTRLLGARWPATAPFLATGRVQATGGGAVSTDEA